MKEETNKPLEDNPLEVTLASEIYRFTRNHSYVFIKIDYLEGEYNFVNFDYKDKSFTYRNIIQDLDNEGVAFTGEMKRSLNELRLIREAISFAYNKLLDYTKREYNRKLEKDKT